MTGGFSLALHFILRFLLMGIPDRIFLLNLISSLFMKQNQSKEAELPRSQRFLDDVQIMPFEKCEDSERSIDVMSEYKPSNQNATANLIHTKLLTRVPFVYNFLSLAKDCIGGNCCRIKKSKSYEYY